jgi:hypothetical protein
VFVELLKGRVLVLYRGYDNVEELERGHIQHHKPYNGHYSHIEVSEGEEVHSEAEDYEGCAGAGAGRPWHMQRWICLQQSDLLTERAVEYVRIIDSPLRGVVRGLVTKTTG